ncbi:MAG: hypothetical protein J6W84_10310, partial [Bacteroidales bacterium]|nr:hypothetical protein [Bacteroidales bacterium]
AVYVCLAGTGRNEMIMLNRKMVILKRLARDVMACSARQLQKRATDANASHIVLTENVRNMEATDIFFEIR